MLSIFRTNQASANIFILIYLLIIRLPVFIFPKNWTPISSGITIDWVYQWMDGEGWLINTIVTLLIFITAVMINELTAEHRLGRSVNLFPGLFYCIFASLIPNFLLPVGLHFANLFLIWGIGQILSTYRKSNCADTIFNIGFLFSLASCFYFSYAIFLLLGVIGLNMMRTLKINEIIILISGFLVPYLLIATWMFWYDRLDEFWAFQALQGGGIIQSDWVEILFPWIVLGVFGFILLWSLVIHPRITSRKKMQEQQKINIIYWVALFSLFSIFIQAKMDLSHLLILSIPLGIVVGLWMTTISTTLSEILHLFLFTGIIFFQYKDLVMT